MWISKKVLVLLSLAFLPHFTYAAEVNYSPVIQIKSYKTTFDSNTELLWWWSASIINDKGVIITNNHVVDDGKGNVLEIFNVCVSPEEWEKTQCPYTASLISRDDAMDIAILKIDEKNIYWQKVDYSKFKTIAVDFDFVPKSWDEVEAVGYPWVGSDTITKTKWIVSGTAKNNDITYIKTDALIAGGNSWGALISWGKLVWIPTFTRGGFSDSNLGYALLISEAKEFITSNLDKAPKTMSDSSFWEYKKLLDGFNDTQSVSDSFLSLSFWNDYELVNYIKNTKVTLTPKTSKESIPQIIEVYLRDMPQVKTENDFLYYVESIGLYSKNYQKLKKTTISWVDIYEPVSIYDSSDGWINVYKNLFGRVGNNLITIYGDLGGVNEGNIKSVAKNFDDFIAKIKFKKDTIPSIVHSFKLERPKVEFLQKDALIYDSPNGFFKMFLWNNLHEFIEVQLNLFDIFTWKSQNVEKIYEQETSDINEDFKTLISYKWHRGFLFCSDTNPYLNLSVDEKGNPLNQNYCRVKLFGFSSGSEEYFIEFYIVTDKKNIQAWLDSLLNGLPKLLIVPTIWDGVTSLPNVYKSQVQLQFGDITWQSEAFKHKVKLLVKYKLIQNERILNPNQPLKWGEFLDLYFRAVYGAQFDKACKMDDYECKFSKYALTINGKQTSLWNIFKDMWVKYKYYVNKAKVQYIQDYFELALAWVDMKNIDEEFLAQYALLKNEDQFAEYKKKVDDINFMMFGSKKILFWSLYPNLADNKFFENKIIFYIKWKGLVEQRFYSVGKVNFTKMSKNIIPEADFYEVLLKGQALDTIVNNIDFGLFDAALRKKKDTNIDGDQG